MSGFCRQPDSPNIEFRLTNQEKFHYYVNKTFLGPGCILKTFFEKVFCINSRKIEGSPVCSKCAHNLHAYGQVNFSFYYIYYKILY